MRPRFRLVPTFTDSLGAEAVDLARSAGLELGPFQADVLEASLGLRSDGKWSAKNVAAVVARQNGKGGIFEGRALAGLFLVPTDELQVYTAHLFKTAGEMQLRLEGLIQSTPDLHSRVRSYKHSHGEEGIYLKNGKRILFMTRSKGGGRGLSIDVAYFDEAMFLAERALGALMPAMSARRNPQRWFLGSAVDRFLHPDGVVFSRIRQRGIAGSDDDLAFFEWSLEYDSPDDVPSAAMLDEELLKAANPALGSWLSLEEIRSERSIMDPRTYAVERLSVGDWHTFSDVPLSDIDLEAWAECADEHSEPRDPVCFAFDITPRRTSASIAVAGYRRDGLPHVEIVDHRPGTSWVAERLAELQGRHRTASIAYGTVSPAESLAPDLERLRVRKVHSVTTSEHASAAGRFLDAVTDRQIRHMGVASRFGVAFDSAVAGAVQKEAGDRFLWSRSKSAVDISPLVAATLALYELSLTGAGANEPMVAFG